MSKIKPCLWVFGDLQEVIDYYQAVFPSMTVESAGEMTAAFEIEGQSFMALKGGPQPFAYSEAVSFYKSCENQAEVDRLWAALTKDGGEEGMCGWLKDKYGLSWQMVPKQFEEMMQGDNPAKVQAMVNAMLQMRKLDVATLRSAYNSA